MKNAVRERVNTSLHFFILLQGTHLVTCAGDGVVKLWDFMHERCAATFTEHAQAAWDVSFHHSGDFIASCSMDQTAKLWDLHRCADCPLATNPHTLPLAVDIIHVFFCVAVVSLLQ